MPPEQRSKIPASFEDVIYGHQIEPEHRRARHERFIGGVRHFHRRSPLMPAAGEPVRLHVTTAGEQPFSEVLCRVRIGAEAERTLPLEAGEVTWDDATWQYVRHWQVDLPPAHHGELVEYWIAARQADSGAWQFADNQAGSADRGTVFAYRVGAPAAPKWAADAVLYHIFIDRFHPGDGRAWRPARRLDEFFGGTLQGVIDRLDYLQSLQVDTLWLSPVFASPSHHGYDSTDLLTVEPRFGTNADLERLIQVLHARGMRLILDFVPNHWSNRHPTFQHAAAHADSPYRDWYLWKSWPDSYEAYFDVQTMPKLNLRKGFPARQHLLDVARFWLEKGVDGYRLDHAEGPDHDFWAEFTQACLEANPDAWLFAEIVRPPDFLRTYVGALHGCLDFALARALRKTFAQRRWSFAQFEAFLADHEGYFPSGFSSPAFLDNHDMHRFLFVVGEDQTRLRLAALMLYALPAAPVVYYGTERGLSQDRTNAQGIGLDEARKPVDWEDESSRDLQAYFANLGRMRRAFRAGRSRDRRLLHLDPAGETYAFLRGEEAEPFIVALNMGDAPREIVVRADLPGDPIDLLGGQPVRVRDGELFITLAPNSGAWIAMPVDSPD